MPRCSWRDLRDYQATTLVAQQDGDASARWNCGFRFSGPASLTCPSINPGQDERYLARRSTAFRELLRMPRNRLGMTLIEIALSISLLGLVLLGLRGLIDALTVADERLAARVHQTERLGIGHRLLYDLLARIDKSGDDGSAFTGSASQASFRSWCESSIGLVERCSVHIEIQSDPGRDVLVGILSGSTAVPLLEGPHGMHLLYLDGPDTSARWEARWQAGIDMPSALGVVIDNDTVLVPIGFAE